tara:strand:+ start:336 stop:548 length:213 start_codon:yes stop_codon:yes gene_type:complete
MKKRLKSKEVYPGLLVGLDAQEYSHFLGEDISSKIGIVVKSITKKRYTVAWTDGIIEDVWIWNLRKRSGQ